MELKALGDPKGMRPSTRRTNLGSADPIGIRVLDDGREAWMVWLPHTQTHAHVVVWIPGDTDFKTVENVVRVNAAGVTEKLLQELES